MTSSQFEREQFDGRSAAVYASLRRRGVHSTKRSDDQSLRRVCMLVAQDQLPERLVMSAAEAVLHCTPKQPVAYFFHVLHSECKRERLFLYDMLAQPSAAGMQRVDRNSEG